MAYKVDRVKGSTKPWRAKLNIKNRKAHLGQYATYKEARTAELREKIRYLQEELDSL